MDPLNLTPAMRKAYDFIRKNGHGTAKHQGVTETTVRALAARGLIELYDMPTGHKNSKAWVAIPLGGKRPRKVDLPHVISAKAPTVSMILGAAEDEQGNPLVKSVMVKTKDGERRTGGFCVTASGEENKIIVSYVTPEDMDLLTVLDVRPAMLTLYAKILRNSGYEVQENVEFGVLYVSK